MYSLKDQREREGRNNKRFINFFYHIIIVDTCIILNRHDNIYRYNNYAS